MHTLIKPLIITSLLTLFSLVNTGCLSMSNAAMEKSKRSIKYEFASDINSSVGVEVPHVEGRELHFPYILNGSNRCLVVQLSQLDSPLPQAVLVEHSHPPPHEGHLSLISFSDSYRDISDMVMVSSHGEINVNDFKERWVHLVVDGQQPETYLSINEEPFDLKRSWIPTETTASLEWVGRPGFGKRAGRKALYLISVPLDVATFPIQLLGALFQ